MVPRFCLRLAGSFFVVEGKRSSEVWVPLFWLGRESEPHRSWNPGNRLGLQAQSEGGGGGEEEGERRGEEEEGGEEGNMAWVTCHVLFIIIGYVQSSSITVLSQMSEWMKIWRARQAKHTHTQTHAHTRAHTRTHAHPRAHTRAHTPRPTYTSADACPHTVCM